MNGNRQRLAWVLVLSGFFICASLAIAVPIGVGAIVQQATRSLDVLVQANQGTVGLLQGDNETGALFAGDPAQSLGANGAILTNATDTALMVVFTPSDQQLLARMQIYGNTNVSLDQAITPRFGASSARNRLSYTLNSGRVQLTVPPIEDRPLDIQLDFPQGRVLIRDAGQYSISTSNVETQVAVLQGHAEVGDGTESLSLETDQRGRLPAEGPIEGPLATERNLIMNGDFARGTEEWVVLAANVELPDQPSVETMVDTIGGEPTLRFFRDGSGHADSGLRQVISQDVTDFESLRLIVSMRLVNQILGVCGQQGSECPLMIQIAYEDVNGVDQTWQQGLYAVGSVGPDTPDVCVACPPPLNEHQRVPYQQLVFYESDNLLDSLGQLGILPRQVKSVTLVASGHAFQTEVVDIALMAKE